MVTKSKSSKIFGILLSLVLLAALSLGALAGYERLDSQSKRTDGSSRYNSSWTNYWIFQEEIIRSLYSVYCRQSPGVDPATTLAPSLVEKRDALDLSSTAGIDDYSPLDEIICSINGTFPMDAEADPNLLYLFRQGSEGAQGNDDRLSPLLSPKNWSDAALEPFQFVVLFRFDPSGWLSVPKVWNAQEGNSAWQREELRSHHSSLLEDQLSRAANILPTQSDVPAPVATPVPTPMEPQDPLPSSLIRSPSGKDLRFENGPKDMTFVLAIPRDMVLRGNLYNIQLGQAATHFCNQIFPPFALLTVGIAALAGLILGLVRPLGLGNGVVLRHLPLEVLLPADGLLLLLILDGGPMSSFVQLSISKTLSHSLKDLLMLSFSGAEHLVLLLNFLAWFCLLGAVYLSLLSYSQLFFGPWKYLKERCLCVKLVLFLKARIQQAWHAATQITLEKPARSAIFKILVVNFVLVSLLCCAWFIGIPLAVAYSLLLYFLIKRRYVTIQAQYHRVLDSLSQMANGQLDAQITEDVGPFEPMKAQLTQVRSGFKKAVDNEVKSQSMKAELITNVSHDLKTPLTAIITYVDLLKNENLTEEQRREYIDTLDRKSQRLKRLIADLFEVSKASSRSISPVLERLDLCALLRQVHAEHDEELQKANIDFRLTLPDHKVPVLLDGQRTCRIFDNLLLNVAKYSMPGTRAYASATEEDGQVRVTVKNISSTELDLDSHDLTERFVRGDKSRNTEGSGLGLAIVKSFVELQNGTFSITADGDLFKAEILWPLAPPQLEEDTGNL